MDWTNVLTQLFEIVLFPLIGVGTTYIIVLIDTKIKEVKQKTKGELSGKYLDMLNTTIAQCVVATTQTYVESLKKQGKFDTEAQKIAFQKTYDNVVGLLADEAKQYLESAVGDLQIYIASRIEAEVAINKQ